MALLLEYFISFVPSDLEQQQSPAEKNYKVFFSDLNYSTKFNFCCVLTRPFDAEAICGTYPGYT